MKRMSKILTVGLLFMVAVMSMGCTSSSVSNEPVKIGEVEQKEKETTEKAFEEKTEYYVGDVLKNRDLQITYVSSGEYKEENEFMQPQDGKKFIFIKLAIENQGTSDQSVSSFSFECYADGYNVDAHYTDNDLSATLSPGRSTDGILVFEVPKDSQSIEVEYDADLFTNKKIKFIYDGEKDSGYVAQVNTTASDNVFSVGDIVESENFNITYVSCERDNSYDMFFEPAAGTHYVTLTFEFENKGNAEEYISMYDFDCYADGKNCDSAYFRDDSLSATLSPGRKAQGTVTFCVPDDSTTVEAEFVSNVWTSSRIVFAVSE